MKTFDPLNGISPSTDVGCKTDEPDEGGDPPPREELLPYPVSPLQHPFKGKSKDNPSRAD